MTLLQPPPAGALPFDSDCFFGGCPNNHDTVLQDAPLGVELPDELTAMLARQAGVDRKCVVLSPGSRCFLGQVFLNTLARLKLFASCARCMYATL